MTTTEGGAPHIQIYRDSKHPWFLWKDVEKPTVRIPPGSVVDAKDTKGQWIARGFYNGHARIRFRALTRNPQEAIDADFFHRRLGRAIEWRRQALKLDEVSDAYRLVHSEGDDLSGLVVDRFNDLIVLEFFSAGMFRFRNLIREILAPHFPGVSFYEFAEKHIQKQESFDCREGAVPEPRVVHEFGLQYHVAPGTRHKTGFFSDQRDNRKLLGEWAKGKRVLDLCCHTGGFGLSALKNGAASSVGLDKDPEALALGKANAKLNGLEAEWVEADLLDWLPAQAKKAERFEVIVLDPPKQTRSSEGIPGALQRYFAMNKSAIAATAPGGMLLTCSCTGLIKENQFLDVIREAALSAGRTLQIFRLSGAGADHPFLGQVPEGRYLKAVWARVL